MSDLTQDVPSPPGADGTEPISKKRKRGWIWYFVTLAVLTAIAIGILIWYNLGQQLTEEKLAAAKKLWEKNRPDNYDMTYTTKGANNYKYEVEVRDGKVRSVVAKPLDGEPGKGQVQLNAAQRASHDMDALFEQLAIWLKKKTEPGKGRVFLRARFDDVDGHVRHYVYSNPADKPQRVEVEVEFKRLEQN